MSRLRIALHPFWSTVPWFGLGLAATFMTIAASAAIWPSAQI